MNVANFPRLHSQSAASLAYRMAKEIGMTDKESYDVRVGAYLHDLGKIAISPSILNKPGPLDKNEWKSIEQHPAIGVDLLMKLTPLQKYKNHVLFHHERWDGKGYPDGLSGDEIPLACQIVSIADAYNAMTSSRPYRSALNTPGALKKMRKGAGRQWNENLVSLLCTLVLKDIKCNQRNM